MLSVQFYGFQSKIVLSLYRTLYDYGAQRVFRSFLAPVTHFGGKYRASVKGDEFSGEGAEKKNDFCDDFTEHIFARFLLLTIFGFFQKSFSKQLFSPSRIFLLKNRSLSVRQPAKVGSKSV